MAKRGPSEASGPLPKKANIRLDDAVIMGAVSGEEEFDVKLLKIRNRHLSTRLKERHVKADMLQQQVYQLETSKADHLKCILALRRYTDDLEVGITTVSAAISVDPSSYGSLPEGDILRFSSSELEHFLDDRREVINSVLTLVTEKLQLDHSEAEEVSEEVLEVLQKLKERNSTSDSDKEAKELLEERIEYLTNQLEDSRHNEEKFQRKIESLQRKLDDAREELEKRPIVESQKKPTEETIQKDEEMETPSGSQCGPPAVTQGMPAKVEQIDKDELSEAKDIAEGRLKEIEQLSKMVTETKQKVETLELELERKAVSDEVIKESAVYKSLQSNFSVVYAENTQLRTYLEEAKQMLVAVMSQYHNQFEDLKLESRRTHQDAKDEILKLETSYSGVKKELEILRVEHEKHIAANDQAVPQNKELRKTITSLQRTTQQQKNDIARYKSKTEQAEQKLMKMREGKSEPDQDVSQVTRESSDVLDLKEKLHIAQEDCKRLKGQLETRKKREDLEEGEEPDEDSRGRHDILESERSLKVELESLQERMVQMRRDYERRKQQIREEAGQRQKLLAEENRQFQKDLLAKRQQEDALMKEMEVMGQAFEDMQEQNIKLLDQLKEKDDANFKLMSERVKSSNLYKLVCEERDTIMAQLMSVVKERDLAKDALMKWEEKERTHEAALNAIEKELNLEKQAVELHKKTAYESAQSLRDVQLKVGEFDSQLNEVKCRLNQKIEDCEKEANGFRRSQEEVVSLKRKLEKFKSKDASALGDEILLEEIKMYKSKLNCPCCGVKKKDTVLTKCFHVFCSECIRIRYETRQRKCPKCNATFGFNDYHKIYLA